jgi:general secretion pathway protein E
MSKGPTGGMAALHGAIMAARAQMRVGKGALTDILTQSVVPVEEWVHYLREQAGIEVCLEAEAGKADFSKWTLAEAKEHRCVLLISQTHPPCLAMEDPFNESVIRRVAKLLGQVPRPLAVTERTMTAWLDAENPQPTQRLAGILMDPVASPIVSFVDKALKAGFKSGASDVHFECDRSGVTVKHRLDGVLVRFSSLSGEQSAQEVISRIKVLALLDITERRLPQDGRFRMGIDDLDVDLRVSIMPSVHGEDAVLRLLDKAQLRGKQNSVTLDLLGFNHAAANQIRELAQMPSGMLLVTGPTGSGKTTTVYAALSEINTGFEKIITIEDPVEYELAGVLQIPVNERKGLTFAKGLRSILRHDPDRILVGEIRDGETAEIAVQSALTGHLVFTTVHANSIGDIVGRFRHFGLDMFGFTSALNGVIVQRLLRRLCSSCAVSRPTIAKERDWMAKHKCEGVDSVLSACGCELCHQSGYRGRFVVAEIHSVDDEFRDHISGGAPLSVLKAHASRQSVASLLMQSLKLAAAGQTTLDEVRRVVGTA